MICLLVGSVGTYIKFTCKNRGVLGNRNAFLKKNTYKHIVIMYVDYGGVTDGQLENARD